MSILKCTDSPQLFSLLVKMMSLLLLTTGRMRSVSRNYLAVWHACMFTFLLFNSGFLKRQAFVSEKISVYGILYRLLDVDTYIHLFVQGFTVGFMIIVCGFFVVVVVVFNLI